MVCHRLHHIESDWSITPPVVPVRVLFVTNGKLVFDGKLDELSEGGSLEEPFRRLTQPVAPQNPPEPPPSEPEPVAEATGSQGEAP